MIIIQRYSKSVFNFENTNGRTADYYPNLITYLELLDSYQSKNTQWTWENYPNLSRYNFYNDIMNTDQFQNRNRQRLDEFINKLTELGLYQDFLQGRLTQADADRVPDLYGLVFKPAGGNSVLDKEIEQKARHYTSNLVKLGLTYDDRLISQVGHDLLNSEDLKKTRLESSLPIENSALVILRQLTKAMINKFSYNVETDKTTIVSYSPFALLIALLLKKSNMSEKYLFQHIALLTPYHVVPTDKLIDSILNGSLNDNIYKYNVKLFGSNNNVFSGLASSRELTREEFGNIDEFKNNRQGNTVDYYYNLYRLNRRFTLDKTEKNLKALFDFSKSGVPYTAVKKRFGNNKGLFTFNPKNLTVERFLADNDDNEFIEMGADNNFYVTVAMFSKRRDCIREYYNSFKKLLTIANVITINNGVVSLTMPKFWESIAKEFDFENHIFGQHDVNGSVNYESDFYPEYFSSITLQEIFNLSETQTERVLTALKAAYGDRSLDDIRSEEAKAQENRLLETVNKMLPRESLADLLPMFTDRTNDSKIQKDITPNATVPTIFEWVVAVAWYYISEEKYSLRQSMNLTLDSEGLPVAQAGGQKNKQDDNSGDITIDYTDRTLLLEVTLMDKNSIKRGEWEPVLRHSVNLSANRTVPVQTYFITDAVDKNTENIWRSVAATDLEETAIQHRSVRAIIYPLTIDTLSNWLHDESVNEKVVWGAIASSYKPLIETDFDSDWKTDILDSISSNN